MSLSRSRCATLSWTVRGAPDRSQGSAPPMNNVTRPVRARHHGREPLAEFQVISPVERDSASRSAIAHVVPSE
jgi:hypothetical protein